MTFQAIFGFVFFFITNISPEEYKGIDVETSVISNVSCATKQVGVVEFLPLASGLEVQVKSEGEHAAELRKASQRNGHIWTPKPFQKYQIRNLEAGVYYLLVSVDGNATEVFQVIIRE